MKNVIKPRAKCLKCYLNTLPVEFSDGVCEKHQAKLQRETLMEAKRLKNAEEQALQASQKEFIESTISAKEVRKQFGLTDEELVTIGSTTKWGCERYGRVNVFYYLKYVSLKKKPQQQSKLL